MPLLSTNRQLLERFRAGDDAALREVFRHYAPRVASSVRSGVRFMKGNASMAFRGPGSESEVQRIVCETFSRAFVGPARLAYDGINPYTSYILRIARNLMINEAIAAKRRPDLTADGILPDIESMDVPSDEAAEQAELTARIRDFVASRPAIEQQIYAARFVDGLSQQDTAAALKVHRITVRRAEARLKAALIDALAGGGP